MSDLPLARTKLIRALNYDTTLLIYVEGLTSGFGGRLIVERSPILIFPPEYVVREEPGNPGINPGASPTDVPTVAAYAFANEGPQESIFVGDAKGRHELAVTKVESAPTSSGISAGRGEVGDCQWTAIHDFMPPGPARLRVAGICLMPTPGYKLSLSRAQPQGINPSTLILNLTKEPPTGIVPQVVTPTPVSYEEETEQHYGQVTIEPDGTTIDVQEVS